METNNRNNFVKKETEISRAENLYVKPKSLLRRLIQKLFLKFLSKLFASKFLFYKNKIKTIMNGIGFYLRLYLSVIYLRFKYPFYFRLPSKQLNAIGTTINFLEILKPQKIDFFLLGGSLLGAVRHESFAGRPQDIDLGIKEEHLQKLLDALPLLTKSGARFIRKEMSNDNYSLDDLANNKIEKIQVLFPCILVDITVYRKKNVGTNEIWIGEIYEHIVKKINGFTFPADDLKNLITIKIYGKEFLSPANPEIYLEQVYGKNWRISLDKKQFFWNKSKFK